MESIKKLREAMNIQQKELALALKVSQPTISDWESGRKVPSGKSLIKIAKFFGKTVEEIVSGEQPKPDEAVPPPMVSDNDIKFALFGEAHDITDEEFAEVKRFAAFVREKRKHDKR